MAVDRTILITFSIDCQPAFMEFFRIRSVSCSLVSAKSFQNEYNRTHCNRYAALWYCDFE